MKLHKSDLEIETIVNRINAGELDLQPDFQRGEIWDNKRRQRLVDTILRGWYVPAVHIVVDSEENDLVLDGQQRFATIRSFLNDELKVNGKIDPPNTEIADLDGMLFSQLPDNVRRRVNRFVIPVVTLRDYNPAEPNELFFRLNQSYNLTPPEKRNALHSHARDQIKDLVAQLSTIGLLHRETVGFNNGRLAYDDIVARSCVAIEKGTLRSHITNTVVEEFYRDGEFADQTIDSVRDSSIRLFNLTRRLRSKIRFNKGTLQTWIIYCHWAYAAGGYDGIPDTLLADFEESRSLLKSGKIDDSMQGRSLRVPIRLFDDRASYRVTDVSSVLARDLAIHLYSLHAFNTPSIRGSEDLLTLLQTIPEEQQQAAFFEFLTESEWGASLPGDHS